MKDEMPNTQMKTPKTDLVRLRISPELKERIRQAASAENRSVSNYIECLILEALGDKHPERIKKKTMENAK